MVQDISSKVKSRLIKGRSYVRSSSFIMALVFTVLCGLAALSIGYFINYFTKGHFVHSTEAVLDAELRYIEAVGTENLPDTGQLYVFLNSDGSLPDSLPSDVTRLAEGILVFDYPEDGKRYAAKIHTFDDNRKMLIGTDITTISKDFRFMQLIGIISICFVMVIVFFSYIISIFVVGGTNKIAETAREIINTGDLSRRVDIGSRWDDLSNTAAVLNMLLDRVQDLMQGVRQVSDNIAHDLRTPLTRMRSHIESLQDKYGHDDYTQLMEETDQVLDTFNALLRISRIEAEKQRSQFCDTDLKKLLEDVVAFYEPLAEEKNIQLTSDISEATLHGDRDLLFQAFANVLDNAVKFTPTDGTVRVKLRRNDNGITIEISDSGAGITEEDKAKIFNRFYRGEKCRSTSGTGLGLSLVSAVITLHGGEITVENTNPGLKIITIL